MAVLMGISWFLLTNFKNLFLWKYKSK